MTEEEVNRGLSDIGSEEDPMVKHLKLASLVSTIFRSQGIELVVVGGSAIEFYTDGAYVSGDLDMCLITPSRRREPQCFYFNDSPQCPHSLASVQTGPPQAGHAAVISPRACFIEAASLEESTAG